MIPVPRDSTDVNELCTAVCEVGAILLDGVLCGVSGLGEGLGESRRYPCHEQGVGGVCVYMLSQILSCSFVHPYTHTPTHPYATLGMSLR